MNPNSSRIWLPAIEAAGLPVPKTVAIDYDHSSISPIFDAVECREFDALVRKVAAAASDMDYPLFMRTDLASAKHSGPTAYLLTGDTDVPGCLYKTLEDNEMKFWTTEGPTQILLRDYLNLEIKFTAFGGLGISREWRLFATAEKVICAHPYWPKESLEGNVDERRWPNWRFLLECMHAEDNVPIGYLHRAAMAAAGAAGPGAWSVDFCRDVMNKWWLLDMARAQDSWHWPDCQNGTTNTIDNQG